MIGNSNDENNNNSNIDAISSRLNQIDLISLTNFQYYKRLNTENVNLLLRDYDPKPTISVAVNQNKYTKLPKHTHCATSHKKLNSSTNNNKRMRNADEPIVYVDKNAATTRKIWSPSKYSSIINTVNTYTTNHSSKEICWKEVVQLWRIEYPHLTNITDQQIKTLYLTAKRKSNTTYNYDNSDNNFIMDISDDITTSITTNNNIIQSGNTHDNNNSNNYNNNNNNNNNNNLDDYDEYNETFNFDQLINNKVLNVNYNNNGDDDDDNNNNNNNITNDNSNNNNYNNNNNTTTTNTTTSTNNINEQLTYYNNQTILRKPTKKQPFSKDEQSILNNVITVFREKIKKSSLKWDTIAYMYQQEALQQYSTDSTKQIFLRTKAQLQQRHKDTINPN